MTKAERIAKLERMENRLIAAWVADSIRRGAEEYAPMYRKFPKLFKQLVKSEINTYRAMVRYFNELNDRALTELDWGEYQRRLQASTPPGATFKAGILDYLVKAFWENETLVLKVFLTQALVDAIEAGGLYSEEDLKVDVSWSRNDPPAIEFMNKYTLKLAKDLTRTTQDRVYESLKTSIANGENRDGAVKRISSVIKDKKRATSIAQTESVRAFNEGRMRVAKDIGADRKRWRTAGAIDFCENFQDEGVVPMNHYYLTPRGVKVLIPPGHPNCRCGHQVFMPDEKV